MSFRDFRGWLSTALILALVAGIAGLAAFVIEWPASYTPLVTAGAASLAALALLYLARPPRVLLYLVTLASWTLGGVVSWVLSPHWDPPTASPATAILMTLAAAVGLSPATWAPLIMGILSCAAILLGLYGGDPGVLEGPGLVVLASAIGRAYMTDSPWGWASLAYASALSYGLIHLDTGTPGLAGVAFPIVAGGFAHAWSSRRLAGRPWIHAFAVAGILGSTGPLMGFGGEPAAVAFAAGLLLYILDALGWIGVTAAVTAAAAIVVASYYGFEGKGWLLLAGAGAATGVTLLKFYIDLVRGRGKGGYGAMIAFIGFSVLFLGVAMVSTGGCSIEFKVEGITTGGSGVTVQVKPSSVLGSMPSLSEYAFNETESRLAELVFRRIAMGTVASLGVVGSIEFYDVELNASLTIHPGEGYIVFAVDKPVSIWFAVEDTQGSYLLRTALKVYGLVIPQDFLEGVDYTPGHTFVRVNYTAPLTVESPAGFRVEAYSVIIYPEALKPGGASVEETALGILLKKAVLGIVEGSVVFPDGVRVRIPASVSAGLFKAWVSIMEEYGESPDKVLLISASPILVYQNALANVDVTLPSVAVVSGEGIECVAALMDGKTIEVLEDCKAPMDLNGFSACIVSPPPLALTPIGGQADLLITALAHNASSTWTKAAAALAAVAMGQRPGTTAWTALYLDVLDLESSQLKGELHPYYAIGFITPFIAAAGFIVWGVSTQDHRGESVGLKDKVKKS